MTSIQNNWQTGMRSYCGLKPTLTPPPLPQREILPIQNKNLGFLIQLFHSRAQKNSTSTHNLNAHLKKGHQINPNSIKGDTRIVIGLLLKALDDLGYDQSILTSPENKPNLDLLKRELPKFLDLPEDKVDKILECWSDDRKIFLFSHVKPLDSESVNNLLQGNGVRPPTHDAKQMGRYRSAVWFNNKIERTF